MSRDLLNLLLLSGLFLVLFGLAELLYHRAGVKAEYTRKTVHVGTGLLTLLFPQMLSSHWWVLLICGSFLLLLLLSLRFKLLPSINAVDRYTLGSILYPSAVYLSFVSFKETGNLAYYYIPILVMALCDPIAALVGRRLRIGKFMVMGGEKTLAGTLAFILAAGVISMVLLQLSGHPGYGSLLWLSIAVTTAIAEALSPKGLDNLTIPVTALVNLFIYDTWIS